MATAASEVWISKRAASAILGCDIQAVGRMISGGILRVRHLPNTRPKISLSDTQRILREVEANSEPTGQAVPA